MRLSGEQFQQLEQALLSAFPTHYDLARMIRIGLDQNPEAITTGNLNEAIFDLISWAEKQDKTSQLVTKAHDYNPGNAELTAIYEALCGAPKTAQSEKAVEPPAEGAACPPIVAVVISAWPEKPKVPPERLPLHADLYARRPSDSRFEWRSSSPAKIKTVEAIRSWLKHELRSVVDWVEARGGDARIEFFLPFHLMDLEVDAWEIELRFTDPAPVGLEHEVVVRNENRARLPIREYALQLRWRSQSADPYIFDPPDGRLRPLYALNRKPECRLFTCSFQVRQHGLPFWKDVIESGIPCGVWARAGTDAASAAAVNPTPFLTGLCARVDSLPRAVLQYRLNVAANALDPVGEGVSLYFESPDVWPPIGPDASETAANVE